MYIATGSIFIMIRFASNIIIKSWRPFAYFTGTTPPPSNPSSTPTESPIPAGASRTILRAPPRRHRLSGVPSGSSDRESIIVLDEYQRHGSRRGSNQSVTSQDSKAIAEAAAAVTAACNKWLSESSGIFTASTQTGSSTNRYFFRQSIHSVEISWFFYHSDFTWNQFWRI